MSPLNLNTAVCRPGPVLNPLTTVNPETRQCGVLGTF